MERINIAGVFLIALLICNSGVAEMRYEYDADGNVTRESYFGVDGKPKADKDGMAEERREYDADGNVTKTSYFGVDGKPVDFNEEVEGVSPSP